MHSWNKSEFTSIRPASDFAGDKVCGTLVVNNKGVYSTMIELCKPNFSFLALSELHTPAGGAGIIFVFTLSLEILNCVNK